jgi:hypothetical protein
VKLDKGPSKSWILQSLNDSAASSELNKCFFSSGSAVERAGIEGAI